jgi:hypothetical protein
MNYQADRNEVKALMKVEYEKMRMMIDGLPPSILEVNHNGSLMKAQLTAFAGAYNKDKSMFEKGVKRYNKYSLLKLDSMRDRGEIIGFIGEADDGNISPYKNDEAFRQAGIELKRNYDLLNTIIPERLIHINYWGK